MNKRDFATPPRPESGSQEDWIDLCQTMAKIVDAKTNGDAVGHLAAFRKRVREACLSESAAQIVQVLPLAPQPETVTTTTHKLTTDFTTTPLSSTAAQIVPPGPVSIHYETVKNELAAVREFMLLVDGSSEFSGTMPMLVENGLCIATTGTGPLGVVNATRIAAALNAIAVSATAPKLPFEANAQAGLKKDAERYRWLRQHPTAHQAAVIVNDTPQGMDKAIDAAMDVRGTDRG